MRKDKFLKNVVTGFGGQLIIIILGLIIPRIMIKSYGSDTNGLISTITQLFTYMALLEAGIGQTARNALYRPIADNDKNTINEVVSTAKAYFSKVTIVYIIAVFVLAIISPIVIKTNISSINVFAIIVFEGLSGACTFYYIQTPTILLNADGKGYVNNLIVLSNKIIVYVLKIVLALIGVNIVIVQFATFLVTVIKVIFYKSYIHKKYNWIDFCKGTKKNLLNDRNSFVLTELAWTIFSSTDMIVLSIFVSTQLSSVYSVYNMVFTNINFLLNSVASSVSYILGQSYHKDIVKYEKLHDALTSLYLGVMTIFMSVSYLLIIPFIKLYTLGVTDTNYIYSSLPIMFCLIQLLSWSRNVSGNLTGLAGYAKQTSYVSLLEAIVNIILSVVLVNKIGIVGVLFATLIALPIKVIWCVYVSDKIVLHRSLKRSLSIIGSNFLLFFIVVESSRFIKIEVKSYTDFIIYGVMLLLVIGCVGVVMNLLINRELASVVKYTFVRNDKK